MHPSARDGCAWSIRRRSRALRLVVDPCLRHQLPDRVLKLVDAMAHLIDCVSMPCKSTISTMGTHTLAIRAQRRTSSNDGVGHSRKPTLHLLKQILNLRGFANVTFSSWVVKTGEGLQRTNMVRSWVLCGTSSSPPPEETAAASCADPTTIQTRSEHVDGKGGKKVQRQDSGAPPSRSARRVRR